MSKIILDFGSGNTCRNDRETIKRMYDELQNVDSKKHEVLVKWQLFKEAGDNIPLDRWAFDFAYLYGRKLGYQVAASVFDLESLKFLLFYDVPFVKIANRRDLDWLIIEVPRKIPIYVSSDNPHYRINTRGGGIKCLVCLSEYPATVEAYEKQGLYKGECISDHTTDFALWNKYQPEIIEWHYKLEDSTGLDAGPFARTPEQLKGVL